MENIRERIVSCAGRVWFCAKELLKWLALAMITGVPCGIIGAAFDLAVERVTELRTEHTAILFLLPVIGLVIVAFYKAAKLEGVSTDDMIDCVKDGKPIRFWLLPVMFISTVLTHLGGGSAGREGAALQMGGTIGWWAGGVLHLNEHERRMAVQCGMAAFFSALFSAPLAATFFAMTIVNVGVVFYAAYIPCFTAAIIAYGVARLIGVTPTRFAVEAPAFEPAMVVRVVLLALACALPLVTIFLFKRRLVQIRLCAVELVLLIGAGAMMGIYFYLCNRYFADSEFYSHTLKISLVFPLVCLVFDLLALRAIFRDEKLVRSLDRIR